LVYSIRAKRTLGRQADADTERGRNVRRLGAEEQDLTSCRTSQWEARGRPISSPNGMMMNACEEGPDWRSLVTDDGVKPQLTVPGAGCGGGGMGQAAAELEAHFQRAVADLSYISRKMDTEFAAHYDEAGYSQVCGLGTAGRQMVV